MSRATREAYGQTLVELVNEGHDIVPVDGADVLQAQILEHDLRHERVLDAEGDEHRGRVVKGGSK